MTLATLIADDLDFVDDLVAVTFTNPDAATQGPVNAFRRAGAFALMSSNGYTANVDNVRWHVKVNLMGTFVPARDGKLVDGSSNTWYINRVTLNTRSTRYEMDTTLEGGKSLR